MNWTISQQGAIDKKDCNIQVSAGAGSGKTAVLTSRVIRILESGINLNKLLILTFTKDAASEMKDRIRKKIQENDSLKDQLNYLDTAYITTFDAYSLSIVKKYGYLENVSNNVSVISDYILTPLKKRYLDEILDQMYNDKNELLFKYLNTFTLKDDTELRKAVLNFLTFIEHKNQKFNYLDAYIDKYYSMDFIDDCINKYCTNVLNKVNDIKKLLQGYNLLDEEYQYLYDTLAPLLSVKTYEELKDIDIKFKPARNNTEDYKECKSKISELVKEIKELSSINVIDMKENILSTKETSLLIIDITKKVYQKISDYEYTNEKYTFSDIASLAYTIVSKNEIIKNELKNSYYEIMIDEYQDTNDVQEDFINLISNNNVYCVGDIKQSIYRFRNANPDLFKEKYKNYSNNIGGYKIDLVENFRSRKEVLESINTIFNEIMTLDTGGADYKLSHQMKFGNSAFEKNKKDQYYGLKVLNYNTDLNKDITEAFIIGNKIKDLINSKYQILAKDHLRDIVYSDITILMDRSTSFDTYKKVFEYLDIPLLLNYDEKLTTENDILVLKNIVGLVLKVHDNVYDEDFRHYYVSVARSFVINMDDNTIFKQIKGNTFKESELFLKVKKLGNDICNSKQLLEDIIDEFNIYEKLISIGKIQECIIRIDTLISIADELSNLGFSTQEFFDTIEEIINDKDQDIKYSLGNTASNSVNITNIHKSKGLEYSVCFFSGYSKKFNIADIKDSYLFTNNFGMILPFYNKGIGNTILRNLYVDEYNKENISERIRLFYVALTRCKELMYILAPFENKKVDKYNSFLNIMDSIKDKLIDYIEDVDVTKLNITDDIGLNIKNYKDFINKNNTVIDKRTININNELLEEKHASKVINKVIDNSEYQLLEYGTYMHEVFETTDFKGNINNENVKKFLDLIGSLNDVNVLKEHEFIYVKDDIEYHGIIDLLLEYNDHIKIIDYKLKNTSDSNYIKQVSIYKDYVATKTDKKIYTYLYSIMDNQLIEISV